MGGVDSLDQMISLYRIFIKSRKWTLRLFMHAIDMALVNSWNEYRNDCRAEGVPNKKVIDLLEFRMRVAEALVMSNQQPKKRGRPSLQDQDADSEISKRTRAERRPINEVRYDRIDHLPIVDQRKDGGRCKLETCKAKSKFICSKCNLHLCLNKDRNCFLIYHSKN